MNPNTTVKAALQEHYRSQEFDSDFLTAKWFYVRIGPIRIPIPNFEQRRRAIYLHDLTHILTGYDTSWTGEGEIAAWELASGFTLKYWMGWIYPPMTFLIGLLISPRKVAKAFRRGWRRPNLYKLDFPRNKIEQMTIGDLKTRLHL